MKLFFLLLLLFAFMLIYAIFVLQLQIDFSSLYNFIVLSMKYWKCFWKGL